MFCWRTIVKGLHHCELVDTKLKLSVIFPENKASKLKAICLFCRNTMSTILQKVFEHSHTHVQFATPSSLFQCCLFPLSVLRVLHHWVMGMKEAGYIITFSSLSKCKTCHFYGSWNILNIEYKCPRTFFQDFSIVGHLIVSWHQISS